MVRLHGILIRDFPITSPISYKMYHLHHVGPLVVKQEAQMEKITLGYSLQWAQG